MKKNLGVMPALFPMPVVVVAAYDASGKPNAMTAAWAQICDMDKIALFVDSEHKTMKNIISLNDIKSVTILRMQVPCCGGLQRAAERALQASGKFIPWQVITVTIDGKILD